MVTSKKPKNKGASNWTGSADAPKVLIYEALATLNRDFEQILRDLDRFEELCVFPQRWQRKLVKTWRATVEETRAWGNFEVLEVLHEKEEREWVRFGRIRQLLEKQSESHEMVAPAKSIQRTTRRRN